MKFIVGILVLCALATSAFANLQCSKVQAVADIPTSWMDMAEHCRVDLRKHIQEEINASFKYFAMGAYFSRDTVNRPGFADMFFAAAKEEREHAMHLIDYLSMRGQLNNTVTKLIVVPEASEEKPPKQEWADAVEALTDALELEAQVTQKIRGLIISCEKIKNDYHLVDYLTGVYLEEQYKGQRDLAGKLSTLKKMKDKHGVLGEFLFDKKLSA